MGEATSIPWHKSNPVALSEPIISQSAANLFLSQRKHGQQVYFVWIRAPSSMECVSAHYLWERENAMHRAMQCNLHPVWQRAWKEPCCSMRIEGCSGQIEGK